MLLPNLSRLEEVGYEVDRTVFREILSCSGKSLDLNKLGRMRALCQVTPLPRKVDKEAASFVKKMKVVS